MLHKDDNPPLNGLNSEEVKFRKIKGLINEPKNTQKAGYFQIILENSLTIFNLINFIIIAALFYFYFKFNDNRLFLDSIGILIVIFINTAISIFQKIKAVRALEKVELLKEKKINVVRNRQTYLIDIAEVVQDDIIYLSRGEQIPVDCQIIDCQKFEVDESLITGESLSILKQVGNSLLSGSFCINGFAYAKVTRVGSDSYSNQITHLAKKFKLTTSPLMNKINVIFSASFIIAIVLIVLEGVRDLSVGEIGIDEVRRISTIAFTVIPEGLIFIAAITFSIGIYRISKKGAIVQKINAIDSFSTINVICLDKTGTITKNDIHLSDLIPLDNNYTVDYLKRLLGSFYKYSSNKNQTINNLSEFEPADELIYIDEIPFDSERKYSAVLFQNSLDNSREVYVLGAMDMLINKIVQDYDIEYLNKLEETELYGKRNILFCKSRVKDFNKTNAGILEISELNPLAIISLKDTIRDDFIEVSKSFIEMGKNYKVLTGDSIDATYTILKDAGLSVTPKDIIDGRNIFQRSNEKIEEIVLNYRYFARLTPSQKLSIVKILKANHQKVCFIGDGINDLPAIKESDLGIAMEEGMTITKEISDIVLQQNKFSLLPAIFEEGNIIINTVRYITSLYLVKNLCVVVMIILNWFVSTPFCLTPRKSSLLSALAVGLPSYFISFRNGNTNSTNHFYKSTLMFVLSTSILILIFVYFSYYISYHVLQHSIEDTTNIMYSVFTLGTITSFYALVAFEDSKSSKYYSIYALIMALLFLFFSLVPINYPPFNLISAFYEFDLLKISQLLFVLAIFVPMILIILIFHRYRKNKEKTNKF